MNTAATATVPTPVTAVPTPITAVPTPVASRAFALGRLLRLENLAVFGTAIAIYAHMGFPLSTFLVLFLAPDFAFVAWAVSPRVGALVYNATHSLIGPGLLAAVGVLPGHPHAFKLALIWVAHIGFDRALGYGLKYGTRFRDTHLGRV
jgi:hypothetical protein